MGQEDRDRLSSWKEISEFLHCDIKTAQRWERERGLPVRRVPGGRKGSVFAYRSELDGWLHGDREPLPKPEPRSARPAWKRRAVIGVGAGTILAGVAGLVLRRGHRRIERVAIAGSTVTAYDSRGGALWDYELPQAAIQTGWETSSDHPKNWRIRIADFDGDGRQSVLMVVSYRGVNLSDPTKDEVLMLSNDGSLRWRYAVEPNLLDRGGGKFEQLWSVSDIILTSAGKGMDIWASIRHHQRWPACVMHFDAGGTHELRFTNYGHIYKLGTMRVNGERLVLAGGISNVHNTSCLAIFGADDAPCAAPADDPPRFGYYNTPKGRPRHFILFPSSELNAPSNRRYNQLLSLTEVGSLLRVEIREGQPPCYYIYEFAADLKPRVVRQSDECATLHQGLEKSGALNHRFGPECPELAKPVALDWWQPSTGWRKVEVPWATKQNLL